MRACWLLPLVLLCGCPEDDSETLTPDAPPQCQIDCSPDGTPAAPPDARADAAPAADDVVDVTLAFAALPDDVAAAALTPVSDAENGTAYVAATGDTYPTPPDVESALAAINTAHNHVSSEISLAHASADQKIVQSKRAVEIETLKAQAEIEPLERMATQLESLKKSGPGVLQAYVRNVRMSLFGRSERAFVEVKS